MRSISHANMRVQFTSLSHRSHRERQGVWFIVSLRLGDGELGAVGKENVVYLRKINGFTIGPLKQLYFRSVLHDGIGEMVPPAIEIRRWRGAALFLGFRGGFL